MYYILLHFPFQSINETNYRLVVALNSTTDLEETTDFIAKMEPLFFKRLPFASSGNNTLYSFEGTLTGSVKVSDDERDDFFEPLVCSKLKFNMAVQQFPGWLLDFCRKRRAKAVLYYDDGLKHELWRGYLIDQTLSLTVVDDQLSVPLVALDEVAMAKYIRFKPSLTHLKAGRWSSLFTLMEHYHDLHHTQGLEDGAAGFADLYSIIGLTSTDRMLWHRNMKLIDDQGDPVNDLPSTLVVNYDRWLQDEESTWEEVFTQLFEYLGVTFAVGSYGVMTVNDAYLLTAPNDSATVQQFVYVFNTSTITSHSYDVYETLTNPHKVGANLQVTAEPDKYSKVKVISEPERWETHEYLTDEHYKTLGTAAVKYSWGSTEDQDDGPFDDFGWHKLKYAKPDSKEADYLTIPPCENGEGYLMARNGELPYDDLESCDNKTEPDALCAGSLDFITFKEGCCCIQLGHGTISGVDEDRLLKPYFLIMNHLWNQMFDHKAHTMQAQHLADTPWLKLRPLGLNASIHPGDKHYLRISMDVMFVRENFPIGSTSDGNPHQHNWFASPGVGHTMRAVMWNSPAMIMPTTETVFDFETDAGPYHGGYNAGLWLWNTLSFSAYIHIGQHYFNGNYWVLVGQGDTPPVCNVTMKNSTTSTREIDKYGYYSLETKNYLYTVSNPCMGNNSVGRNTDNAMLVDLYGISVHTQPVNGVLEMEILGQIHFQKSTQSVPWVLIDNIDINYTDDSDMLEADIKNTNTWTMDAASTSKETMEKKLDLASPSVNGFFNNALLYDGGKLWHNLSQLTPQTGSQFNAMPEFWLCLQLSYQYGKGQQFVELTTPVDPDDNIHNVCFRVTGLTEVAGRFLPVKRDFDYVTDTLRVKLQRVNTQEVV